MRWREINKHLTEDINTILDVGGGTGAFSIPLAEKGFKVVHFDISEEMIAIAKSKAEEKNLKNITFEQGISIDLSRFNDNSFDMVIMRGLTNYSMRIEKTPYLRRCSMK